MERRQGQRIKRRIPCEFASGGHRYRGIVVDLSVRGLFLHTDTALDPGEELEVQLSGTRFPDVTLRAVVARRRFTPAILASMIRRGVGLRILQAPPEYYEAVSQLRDRDEAAADAGDQSEEPTIEIVVSDDPEATLPADPRGAVSPSPRWSTWEPARKPTGEDDAPALPSEPSPEGDADGEPRWEFVSEPALPAESAPPAVDAEPSLEEPTEPGVREPEADEPEAEPGGTDDDPSQAYWISPETPYPSEAILIDSGELDDVYELLEEFGANPVLHRSRDPARFRGWARPPRVLVASARMALRLRIPVSAETQGVVTVAVAEADSHTVCNALRRHGFRYVVRRPLHPEALRLFLLRTLYRDHDRRGAGRVPFGYEVTWRKGLRRFKGTLVEISSEGCRLLTTEFLNPACRIWIRIPRQVAGGRAFVLSGRVVRSERRRSRNRDTRVALALRFDRLSPRTRERLIGLLTEYAVGPPTLPRQAKPMATRPTTPGLEPAPQAAPDPPRAEQRRHPRVALLREVLALDERLERVRYVLFGRDLSVGGMRVESHPEVAKGDRLQLALYQAEESLVVEAEVIRDDEERGLGLAFLAPAPEALEKLARVVESLPAIEDPTRGGQGVVIAEILRADAAP